jgi:hypothetical protein
VWKRSAKAAAQAPVLVVDELQRRETSNRATSPWLIGATCREALCLTAYKACQRNWQS